MTTPSAAELNGDGGLATSATLRNPSFVTFNPTSGSVMISDSYGAGLAAVGADELKWLSRFRQVSPAGIITTVAGYNYALSSIGDGGAATNAVMFYLSSCAVDSSNNVYVSSLFYSPRVRLISKSTGIITTVAGTGAVGSVGDGGLGTAAQVSYVYDLDVAANGDLYIVDGDSRVRMVSKSTGTITTVADNGNGNACGGTSLADGVAATSGSVCVSYIAVDAVGNLFLVGGYNNGNSYSVRLVTKSTGLITTIAGTTAGNQNQVAVMQSISGITITTAQSAAFQSSFVNAVAAAAGVSASAVSITGAVTWYSTVYVGYTVVGITSPPNSALLTTALTAAGYTGVVVSSPTYNSGSSNQWSTGDGGAATSATLTGLRGVAVDATGNVYVADNDRVRVVTKSTGVISTVPGGGAVAPVVVVQVRQSVQGVTLATAQSAVFQTNFKGVVAAALGLTVDAIGITDVTIDASSSSSCSGSTAACWHCC